MPTAAWWAPLAREGEIRSRSWPVTTNDNPGAGADATQDPRELLLAARRALLDLGDVEVAPSHKTTATEKVDDDATPLSEMHQVIASRRNQERTGNLRAIDAALARLAADPDSYGLCMDCEEPIKPRRLRLMPWVTRCIQCQAGGESDVGRPGRRRHLTDYD